jgi:uncharacterized protein YgiM (DUF1202 family)
MVNPSPPHPLSRVREQGNKRGVGKAILCCLLLLLLVTACAAPPAVPSQEPEAEAAAAPSPEATETATLAPTAAPTSTRDEIVLPPSVTPTPTPTPGPVDTPTPEPERVRVTGSGSQGANMRREPGTSFPVVKTVRDGAEVTIVGTDREVEGRIWRNVRDGDAVGWMVATVLRAAPTPTVTPGSAPSTAETPTRAGTTTAPASGTATAAATAAATATPQPERVEVYGTGGQGANLRAEPGTGAPVLQTVPDGTRLTVIGQDRDVDGRVWRNVRGDGGTVGWLVDETVRPVETPTPAATATPSPAATPTAATSTPTLAFTPTPSGPASAAAPPTPTPAPPGSAPPNPDGEPAEPTPEPERVEVYGTDPQGANLRARPGRSGSVLQSVPDGSRLTVIGADQVVDGITWRNVQTEGGVSGWLAQEVIKTVVTPTPTPRPGSAGIGVPIPALELPEEEFTDAQRAATPCRPGQVKGDAAAGLYYLPDRPEYAGLRERVRCFDDTDRAEASGFLPAPPPVPEPSDNEEAGE